MNARALTNHRFNFLANIIFLLIILFSSKIYAVDNNLLKVTVTSGIDNTPLANQSVVVYLRLEDGSRKGFRTVTTDGSGKLSLDLPGLGSGTHYELRTLPKHGKLVMFSGKISNPGDFAFKVGNVRVKAVNGLTNATITSHKVRVYKHAENGTNTSFIFGNTDASGFVDFYLPNISSAQQYLFKSASLSDNHIWSSNPISTAGLSTFVIGNRLLKVTVTSGIDNTPLANQSVVVYLRLDDGSRKGFRTVTTDGSGKLSLDLPGLGSGTHYELRTLPKHGKLVMFSGKISNPGDFTFKVGNVRVKAVNGLTNAAITSHKVRVYKHAENGTNTSFIFGNTDASGFVDFYLPNISSAQQYLFKSASLSDNHIWSSNPISTAGLSTFVIGNRLLKVTVTSGIDNTPLANQSVVVYLRREDGSRKGFRTVTTDGSGKLSLDLPGLGSGTHYELRTLPKHGKLVMFSGKISNPGDFAFKVGNVRVKAVNGLTNAAITSHKVRVYKHAENGTNTSFIFDSTDASGFVDFYLPNISSAQQYLFKSASLSDNRTWSSNPISTAGLSTFVIGSKLLKVTLVNALDNKPIPNTEVRAYKRMPDNSLNWSQKKTSDINGQIDFDLQGLGSGSKYVLLTKPYGPRILSKDITRTGNYKIQAGAIEVTLRKKHDNSLMKEHKLYLYEKVSPGKIEWRTTSRTNQKGKVHFDSTGLGSGKIYLIKGKNLFGKNKNYYSQWILSKGQYNFIVAPDDPHKLDEEVPRFGQFYPKNKSILSDNGFALKMQVTDNNRVKNVAIRILDPVKGTTSGQATLSNNEWGFLVTADMISKDQTITVKAEATDQTGNKSTLSYQYSIINDVEEPILSITSHQNNNQIDENGFFLTGAVSDNTRYVKLLATVIDPIKGKTIDHKELEIGENHHWALLAKDLSRGQDVIVKLQAIDSANNTVNKQLSLSVMTDNESMVQLINRITFGATPQLLKELRDYGTDSFIAQQLHPELIDDSAFEQQLASLLLKHTSPLRKLQYSQVARAISSKRQLLEVMTQFWESHFNTDLGKVKTVIYEVQENNAFRKNALGNFRDLLQISATSPAMLKYLNNVDSRKEGPNENYARELMELHTLGVDNSYTSDDIVDVARTFTGWGLNGGAFSFAQRHHDDGEKSILNIVVPAGSGVTGGEMILDLLAEHESTAQSICTKLLKVFVSDTPTNESINRCATDFLTHIDKENQIALILKGIFKSDSFSKSFNFHTKVKTPFEFLIGLYRQLPTSINYHNNRIYLSELGMPLFYYPMPTGWPETSDLLVNSNQLMQRWKITNTTIFSTPSKYRTHLLEPKKFLIDSGIETTEGVLGYLFEILLAHDYSKLEWNEALSLLTDNQTEKFDIYTPDAELQIRNVIALMLQYPTYQLQ